MRYVDAVETEKQISKIGLGTWQFGSREWGYGDNYADQRAQAIVSRALELGVTLFDTAEAYGTGASERILGKALGERVTDVFIATKIFPVWPTAGVVEHHAVASAQRLGVKQIDLYQVHQPNPVIRDSRTMPGMAALQQVGLVDEVGVSNYSLERWQAAEAALGSRVLSNQVQYSLVDRKPDRDLVPWAAAEGRIIIAWSPLAQGFLSGRYSPDHLPANLIRRVNPKFSAESFERAKPLFATLREVADTHDATPSQVALAWLIHHPNVVAIPGASSVEQVQSNVAAADLELTDDEYAALSADSDKLKIPSGISLAPLARRLVGR